MIKSQVALLVLNFKCHGYFNDDPWQVVKLLYNKTFFKPCY